MRPKVRKCPCIDCMCLPICRSRSSIEICQKCSSICEYITVHNKTTGMYRWLNVIKTFGVKSPFSAFPIVVNGKTLFLRFNESKKWYEKNKEKQKH
jgi:hypothetical protein